VWTVILCCCLSNPAKSRQKQIQFFQTKKLLKIV
jgi:hypothetical protein